MARNSQSTDGYDHFQACLNRLYYMDIESLADEGEEMDVVEEPTEPAVIFTDSNEGTAVDVDPVPPPQRDPLEIGNGDSPNKLETDVEIGDDDDSSSLPILSPPTMDALLTDESDGDVDSDLTRLNKTSSTIADFVESSSGDGIAEPDYAELCSAVDEPSPGSSSTAANVDDGDSPKVARRKLPVKRLLLSSTSASSSDEDSSATADDRDAFPDPVPAAFPAALPDAYPVLRPARVVVQRLDSTNVLREEISRVERQMQNEEKNGLKALQDAFPITNAVIQELRAKNVHHKGDKNPEKAVVKTLLDGLYSPLFFDLHKKTSVATKRQECEDIYIPLPEQELQQIRDALEKVYPGTYGGRGSNAIRKSMENAMTQKFNRCSEENKIWLRNYKQLQYMLARETDKE